MYSDEAMRQVDDAQGCKLGSEGQIRRLKKPHVVVENAQLREATIGVLATSSLKQQQKTDVAVKLVGECLSICLPLCPRSF